MSRSPRTLAQIQADPRVARVWREDDGWYWADLSIGHSTAEPTHSLHERTVADLASALGRTTPCDSDCWCRR